MKKLVMVLAMVISMAVLASCGTKEEADIEVQPTEAVAEQPDTAEQLEADTPETKQNGEEKKSTEAADVTTESGVTAEQKETAEVGDTLITESGVNTEETEPVINRDDINTLDAPKTMYVQKSLNIRKGPGTEFDVVGHVALNDEVSVVGESKSTPWKEITYKNETAFVHGDYLGTDKVEVVAAPQPAQADNANATAQAVQPAPVVQAKSMPGVLFIGDSRTCQMRSATGGAGCGWICEYATSYDWFAETAIPQADPMIGKGTKVVICMGVNDPRNYNSYATLVNQKAGEWNARGAKVYYVSVNPVCAPYEDKTMAIDEFNANMPSLLSGVYWIDTASVVKQGGYVLEDGIHYDTAGNVNIFNLICGCLR